jgi:hypothetical protein
MEPIAWDTRRLCEIDDLTDRVSDLSIPLQGELKKNREKVEKKITLAKNLITQELRSKVIPRFQAYFTAEQLLTHLDYLTNPEELKYAAVDLTLALLLEDGELQFTADWEKSGEALNGLAERYYKRYAEKLTTALGVLVFDRFAGNVEDGETLASTKKYYTYRS